MAGRLNQQRGATMRKTKATMKPKGRARLYKRKARIETQDVEPLQAAGAMLGKTGSAFFAVAGIQRDGSLREIGGTGRTWASEEDYHRERGWRAGTVVRYYPADFDKAPSGGAV